MVKNTNSEQALGLLSNPRRHAGVHNGTGDNSTRSLYSLQRINAPRVKWLAKFVCLQSRHQTLSNGFSCFAPNFFYMQSVFSSENFHPLRILRHANEALACLARMLFT